MKFSSSIVFAVQALTVFALPAPNKNKVGVSTSAAALIASATTVAAVATATATATPATGEAKDEEEKEAGETEQEGAFGVAINLNGGDVKTDTEFPPGTNGKFEVEFKNPQARVLRVTENNTPAAAPVGFTAFEPSSYKVELSGSGKGLTLSKIDYIGNTGVDVSQVQLGRLCTETNSFVVGGGVVEREFEAEENEIASNVDNLVGEFGFFVPAAAGTGTATEGAATGNATTGGATTGGATTGGATTGVAATLKGCEAGTACRALLDALLQAVGN
ncbi:hypothetical protein B0H63DRAFT_563793 [Podospora didyma]|uniref:Cell wall protein n=1 Tax=Podospora didyma TaxID=330526 RepID=A0AAE0KAD4_9PEZI|nr:hypothetical protein B0H63DRAFT_563793 [Podospora didyma]